MKNKLSKFNRIKAGYFRIHFVDRCLITFMIVLLLQSAYSLFFNNNSNVEVNNIDVIVRTSIAGIFGYFLSANFIRRGGMNYTKNRKDDAMAASPQILGEVDPTLNSSITSNQIKIGFEQPEVETELEMDSVDINATEDSDSENFITGRLQVIVATVIGLFCLGALLIMRNVSHLNVDMNASATSTATVAQFRDLISGCVGFLIGCPTNQSK